MREKDREDQGRVRLRQKEDKTEIESDEQDKQINLFTNPLHQV